MNEKYFYKIKDIEDDKYSIYIWTDTECYDLIEQAVEQCKADDEYDETLMFYVDRMLKENKIKYSIIDWEVIDF